MATTLAAMTTTIPEITQTATINDEALTTSMTMNVQTTNHIHHAATMTTAPTTDPTMETQAETKQTTTAATTMETTHATPCATTTSLNTPIFSLAGGRHNAPPLHRPPSYIGATQSTVTQDKQQQPTRKTITTQIHYSIH